MSRPRRAVGRGLRVMVALSIPVALILLVTQTSVLEAAVTRLPPPMKRIVRGAQNYVIVQLAPVRDGLRWIDVPDPRSQARRQIAYARPFRLDARAKPRRSISTVNRIGNLRARRGAQRPQPRHARS